MAKVDFILSVVKVVEFDEAVVEVKGLQRYRIGLKLCVMSVMCNCTLRNDLVLGSYRDRMSDRFCNRPKRETGRDAEKAGVLYRNGRGSFRWPAGSTTRQTPD